ncbi:MAG: hypothetical protein KGI02_05000 [Thaumarchaeota archaeon]|nr:hypothetical protein [Nitrososphaerota archaeon]
MSKPAEKQGGNQAGQGGKVTLQAVDITQTLSGVFTSLQAVNSNTTPSVTLPSKIFGTLLESDKKTPCSNVIIEVLSPSPATGNAAKQPTNQAGSRVIATGISDSNGNFSISIPKGTFIPTGQPLQLRVRGSSPSVQSIQVPPNLLGPSGYLGTFSLQQDVLPIPSYISDSLLGDLSADIEPSSGSTPTIHLGDGQDCVRVIENQSSVDRFPYGIFFNFISPTLYQETEQVGGQPNPSNIYGSLRTDTEFKRTNIAAPISIDEFHDNLISPQPLLVGSLGLGYILRCAQKWTFQGLALGNLVYSLPLAPGEQQQIVVVEQQTSLQLRDTEAIYGSSQAEASAATDSSTQAIFQSAFNQAAQGGSSFTTGSVTTAFTAGGGIPSIFGGPSLSIGGTVSSGSSSNWMDGAQNYASTATQSAQTYAEQQSNAVRNAQRVAMRMATSSESTEVTTKTITNHNKLHALTFQYFEVSRLYDIETVYEGVSLVCLVPLDITWFLPPGQPKNLGDVLNNNDLNTAIQEISALDSSLAKILQLTGGARTPAALQQIQRSLSILDNKSQQILNLLQQINGAITNVGITRQQVLDRYSALLDHSDVLKRWLPYQYLSGLTKLEQFASDPRAVVELNSVAEDIIKIEANISVLPFDHVYVTAVTRWGGRLGPVELIPNQPVIIPEQPSQSNPIYTEDDLVSYLKGQRISSQIVVRASISLPPILSPSDIIGFEITHTFDRFSYQLSTPLDTVTNLFGNNGNNWPSGIFGFLPGIINPPPNPVITLNATDIASKIEPPIMFIFRANIVYGSDETSESYVNSQPNVELPPNAYPIAASEISPILKYSDLILIENVLQHILRNMIRYSKAVWTSLTPEERVMLLEPYSLNYPGMTGSTVPLLECIGTEVLGFYGNCMMLPFSIPKVLSDSIGTAIQNQLKLTQDQMDKMGPVTTGSLETSLFNFHNLNAPNFVSRISLPTNGVLGEAMLGHCSSGEKIDITRFWNWQDSPADQAPAIATVSVPSSNVSTLAAAQTPNALGGMLPTLVNNVNAPSVSPVDTLAAALAQKAPAAQLPDLSGITQLANLLQSTQNTANQARQNALDDQTAITNNAITQASNVLQSLLGGGSKSGGNGSSKTPGSGSSGSSGSNSAISQAAISAIIQAIIAGAAG